LIQKNSKKTTFIVSEESAGIRIDNFLSEKIPDRSRSHLQKSIESLFVKVNGKSVSKNCKLNPGDNVEYVDSDTIEHAFTGNIKPQKIPLKILYEDDYYLIISKDAGISVHPSPGRYENTLVNALLFYFKNSGKNFSYFIDSMNNSDSINTMESIFSLDTGVDYSCTEGTDGLHSSSNNGVDKTNSSMINGSTEDTGHSGSIYSMDNMRPGIIHRLDKDTSGLIIVAKDSSSQYKMAELFKNRQVEKTYLTLVAGHFSEKKGKISLPIGRSRIDRKKMAVSIDSGRIAVTDFEIREDFRECTLLNAYPKTGRTHQIRVHFSYIDHPVIGDKTYGNSESTRIGNALGLNRQFLHAKKLSFYHPITSKMIEIEDELAQDLKKSLEMLREPII
jgi:23S rRNA-/tRNA-specific pseudouridylate synthase